MKRQLNLWVLKCILGVFLISSCSSQRMVYFNDLPDTAEFEWMAAEFTEPVIQRDDILNINIQTVDPTNSAAVNQGTTMQLLGAGGNSSGQQTTGFLVDRNGKVSIPMFGEIEVAGLTTQQAREVITEKVAVYY